LPGHIPPHNFGQSITVPRIMTINNLDAIAPEAIEAARETLVVGA